MSSLEINSAASPLSALCSLEGLIQAANCRSEKSTRILSTEHPNP